MYFRAWVFDQAKSLGLTGWVRNLQDGKVEILAQGASEGLDALKERLSQGSPLSRVESVKADMIDYEKQYADFAIRG